VQFAEKLSPLKGFRKLKTIRVKNSIVQDNPIQTKYENVSQSNVKDGKLDNYLKESARIPNRETILSKQQVNVPSTNIEPRLLDTQGTLTNNSFW
jgi:hypothetical protein